MVDEKKAGTVTDPEASGETATAIGDAEDVRSRDLADQTDDSDAAPDETSEHGDAESGSQAGAKSRDLGQPESRGEDSTPPVTGVAPAKSGRGLAAVALFLGLFGMGGMGYLYFELIYKNPLATLAGGLQTQQDALVRISGEINAALAASDDQRRATLNEALAVQADRMTEVEVRTTQALQEALQAAPPSQKAWKRAEAEYLLRIANHRVLMEQDSEGALTLLLAADQILSELDDFALHAVRARLADEMLALKQVPADNLQSIYLRLEAMKSQAAELRPILSEFQAGRDTPDSAQTVWEQIATATKELIRIRTLTDEAGLAPLVGPDEETFLKQHLQLSLLQAQLGALKRQQDVYELALTNTRRYLNDYMELNEHPVLMAELDALMALQLDRPLPDLSGSLNELLSAVGAP